MDPTSNSRPAWRGHWWFVWSLAILAFYVLSSGPVLAAAFWLREATRYDGFYSVMWLYYPLFWLFQSHNTLWMRYIEWWVVDVFHTVGPG